MKISKAIDIVRVAIRNNFPIMLKGKPGCAKTEGIRLACELENMPLEIFHPVSWDVCDGRGLPSADENNSSLAKFRIFGDLFKMNSCTVPTLFFFDDVGQSAQMVQALIMQITQERSINGVSISPFARFAFATNNRKDGAGVAGIITPLVNRMFSILEIEADAGDWINWGKNNNIPVELLGFVSFRPELICNFNPALHKDSPFASPRSIHFLAQWLNAGVNDLEVWEGCVGTEFAVQFLAYWEAFAELRGLPEKIEKGIRITVPTRPDLIFALNNAIARRAKDSTLRNIYSYFKGLDSEYTVSGMIAVSQLHPELKETPEMVDFMIRHQNSL